MIGLYFSSNILSYVNNNVLSFFEYSNDGSAVMAEANRSERNLCLHRLFSTNIVAAYPLTSSSLDCKQILNAISAILSFFPSKQYDKASNINPFSSFLVLPSKYLHSKNCATTSSSKKQRPKKHMPLI